MDETTLLNHYKILSLYPSEYPVEKDNEDNEDSDGDDIHEPPSRVTSKSIAQVPVQRSRSRYSILERPNGRRSIAGFEKTKEGADNLVQKDEPDPLGSSMSVVNVLRSTGLPVEQDMKLRNKFLLSSTTFNPSLFLSHIHNNDSTQDLMQGLEFLSHSIEKKSASLKVLVESNFERFVRAKATIDTVYNEMRGKNTETSPDPSHKRKHSRNLSRNSIGGHFRNSSGAFSPRLGVDNGRSTTPEKRKNALLKENDYGVAPIKAPILEVAVRAEEVWGPALGSRDKEETLRAILGAVEKHRAIFELSVSIADSIKRRDNDSIVEEYARARKYADDARAMVEGALESGVQMQDREIEQVIVTARMWNDVESQVAKFKQGVWNRLAGTHFTRPGTAVEENEPEEHMELISILLELGVDDNPIWIWLLSRYDFLKNKIIATAERSKIEVEILRRRLASGERPSMKMIATHLRSAGSHGKPSNLATFDSTKVLEFWEHLYTTMNAMLSAQGGILGEVIEYWATAESFINGKAQQSLPPGIDGHGIRHHRLSTAGVDSLRTGARELISLIRDSIHAIFSDPPTEDISLLLSPIPNSPGTPRTPASATLPPFSDTRFQFDPQHLPPPSPLRGDPWESYSFWPPFANSLSAAHYLGRLLNLLGTAASEMASLSIMRDGTGARPTESLKALINVARERCVAAVCAAWVADAENARVLEDWTRSADAKELTNLPTRLMAFEGTVLGSMQRMLYVSEAMNRQGSSEVVVPPSAKLLQQVRQQFVGSLYKALSGIVENAKRPRKAEREMWEVDPDSLLAPANKAGRVESGSVVDSSNANTRILLTLSNLNAIRHDIVPHLITQFETDFSVQLASETSTIADLLSQIDAQLFHSYVDPLAASHRALLFAAIPSPDWAPTQKPTATSSYVSDVLLSLVLTHTEVASAASPLLPRILQHLLEQLFEAMIGALGERKRYPLPALMQATIDCEFTAQTLMAYTTNKVTELQGAIYPMLDGKTDHEARFQLKNELPEMKMTLKRLKESTQGEL
ncbi:exocyst complex component Sec5 [Eremomyces bilateralis CBS 781.70]|uniref:Exocyst complex component SEC5 n=1 Tax=Eremomyces bilateralis CBS 781.70 TaxID=1392243 RepID=A0A6G1G072_9PEZI|nr:exocyst complex component Sec5 [Eremomyces bilateralis CBS 781.70]KAF1811418.1 exocyst complex component Sec5 [Eremomyces bilateralis CBS 781.70]